MGKLFKRTMTHFNQINIYFLINVIKTLVQLKSKVNLQLDIKLLCFETIPFNQKFGKRQFLYLSPKSPPPPLLVFPKEPQHKIS